MYDLIDISCLILFLITSLLALYILKAQGLLAVTVTSSMFSVTCALLYALLGAPDVALTESAVGAGLYTILAVITIFSVKHVFNHPSIQEHRSDNSHKARVNKLYMRYIIVVAGAILFAVMVVALKELPLFGSFSNPTINQTYFVYLQDTFHVHKVNNAVSMILGSFRSLDTLCETLVIFVSLFVVWSILSNIKGQAVEDQKERQVERTSTLTDNSTEENNA